MLHVFRYIEFFYEIFVICFQEKNPQEKPAADIRKNYEDIVRENASFEEYYKVSFCLFIFTSLDWFITHPFINKLSLQELGIIT